MAEEAKDATAVVVARAPPGDPKIASVGLRRSNRDDDSPFAAVASALEFQDRSTCCVRRARPSEALRRRCADFVAHFPDHFREEVLGQAPAAYAAWLSKADLNRHRCGEPELVALAETLGLEIAVWSTLFEGDAPLVYKPVNPIRRAHLLFSGAHYDLIVARATSGAVAATFDVEDVESARAIRRRVGDAVRRWRAANGDCYWAHANDARHPPLLS